MRWEVVLVRRGQLGFYRSYDLLVCDAGHGMKQCLPAFLPGVGGTA